MEYFEPIPAIQVKQGSFVFYIFTISAKRLLSISYTSERTRNNQDGIQRGLRRDRLISIGKYLQSQTGGTPILPNAIIISLSQDSNFKNGYINIADKRNGEAFVIDGQHRLWSFNSEFSGDYDIDIVVSAFIDLKDDKKALIFKIINGEQRKINPSLVYDLIPMLRDKESVQFEDWRSQEIVSHLNMESKSPWANKISMVGEPGKILSQSSFITAVKKLFKKGHLFNANDSPDFLEAVIQENLLIEYFISISDHYSIEWDNKDYLLCKYVGVSALLMLLESIIKDMKENGVPLVNERGLAINSENFNSYIEVLRKYNFSAKESKSEGKSYVGEGGINELFKRISSIVFPSK